MPMDPSAVRALCDSAVRSMRDVLHVGHVRVDLTYHPSHSDGVAASCEYDAPYETAAVNVDPAAHDDESDVLDSLRHEILHVVLGEWDVYRNVAEGLTGRDAAPVVTDTLGRAFTLAAERTIKRLERILDEAGWTPEAMAGRETTCSGCGRAWRATAPEGTAAVECPGCGDPVTHGRAPDA